MSFWGLGLTQSVDAAAMDLYLFYRNYSTELTDRGFDAEDLHPGRRRRDHPVLIADGLLQRHREPPLGAALFIFPLSPSSFSPSPRLRGEGQGEGQVLHDLSQASAPHPDPLPFVKDGGERENPGSDSIGRVFSMQRLAAYTRVPTVAL